MDAADIHYAAKDIATRLANEMKALRIMRVDFEVVRATVAGYLCGAAIAGHVATKQQIEDLENLALRKFVEACA